MTERDSSVVPARPVLATELDLLVPDIDGPGLGPATAFFLGLSGRHAGMLFRVGAGESSLGRTSRSLVSFDEKAVSQRHAQVVHAGGRTVIVDLGSTNGTFVNNRRIDAPVELHAGDVVRIGKTSLGFLTDASDAQQHTRALATSSGGLVRFSPAQAVSPYTSAASRSIVAVPDALQTTGEEPNPLDQLLDRAAVAWKFVQRYWRWALAGAIIGGMLGGATVLVSPPKAVARCRIFLKHQGSDDAHGPYAARGGEYFRFAIENFTSTDLIRETLRKLKREVTVSSVGAVENSLVLVSEFEGMYQGSFYHIDLDFAERFLAEHLHTYLEREIQKSIRVAAEEVALVQKQYQETEQQLVRIEGELREFKEQHLAGLPEHAGAQLESRAGLESRALDLRAQLQRSTQELALAEREYAAANPLASDRIQSAAPYAAALASVRQKIAAAKARGLTESHPEMVQLKAEEQGLLDLEKETIAKETSSEERRANRELTALASRVGQLQVAVTSTKTELGLVEGRLAEMAGIAAALPAVEQRYSDLSRQHETTQSLHEHLHEQLKARQLKLEFERANAAGRYDLVSPPSALPVSKARVAGTRTGIGAAAGIGVAAVLAALHWLMGYARGRRFAPMAPSNIE